MTPLVDTLWIFNLVMLGFAGLVVGAYTLLVALASLIARSSQSRAWQQVRQRMDPHLIRGIDWVIRHTGGTPPPRGRA